GRADEAGPEQEVFRRVARDGELGEEDEVGAMGLRLLEAAENQVPVVVEVADHRVDLGEREPHTLSLAVCYSEAKNAASAAPAERRYPERHAVPPEDPPALDGDPEVAPAPPEQVRAMRRRAQP